MLSAIAKILLAPVILVSSWISPPIVELQPPSQVTVQETVTFGTFNTVGGKNYFLHGGGIGSTDTSVTLTNFQVPVANIDFTMSNFGDIGYLTIEPGSASRQEFISFTGITNNSDGTDTLTGVTRGLSPITPYTASTTLRAAHPGGSVVVVSNPPQLYERLATREENETISGDWNFSGNAPSASSDPVDAEDLARRSWVLTQVNGGAVSQNSIIVSGNAGATVATGTIVYFNRYDGEWINADADVASTSMGVLLGVTQGAGTDGNAITNGVMLEGDDANNPGGTAGRIIYLSGTAGATTTTAGTFRRALGQMRSSTRFYFNPNFPSPDNLLFVGNASTTQISASERLYVTGTSTQATTTIEGVNAWSIGKNIFASSTDGTGTWTRPNYVTRVRVTLIGAGGGGGGSGNTGGDQACGGGGGAYLVGTFDVSASSTPYFILGNGGAGGSGGGANAGTAGGDSVFGGNATSTGGGAGSGASGGSNCTTNGAGGTASGGTVHISGQAGGDASTILGPGKGGDSVLGKGGREAELADTAAVGPGAGGYGAGQNRAGGAGTDGMIIIEY